MKRLIVVLAGGVLIAAPWQMAAAKGCITGAAVGGAAGHVAGHHAVLGAAAGCAINHHRNTVKDRQAAAAARNAQQNGPVTSTTLVTPATPR